MIRKKSIKWLPMVLAGCLTLLFVAIVQAESYELDGGALKKMQSYPTGSPEHKLQQISKLISEGKSGKAEDLADDWIDEYPYHTNVARAYLLRGDAKASGKSYFKALFDYEMIARAYPDSPEFHKALEREFQIAETFASGTKRKLWGMRIMPADEEAEELFIRIQERSPGSRLAEKSGKALGDYYYRKKDMILAAEAYDIFLDTYPRSQWQAEAMRKQVDANLATFKGPRFDATGLIEAQERLNEFKKRFPALAEKHGSDALLVRINESQAQKALVTANWYHKRRKLVSAKFMYERVMRDFPESAAFLEAKIKLDKLTGKSSTKSPADKEVVAEEQVPVGVEPQDSASEEQSVNDAPADHATLPQTSTTDSKNNE